MGTVGGDWCFVYGIFFPVVGGNGWRRGLDGISAYFVYYENSHKSIWYNLVRVICFFFVISINRCKFYVCIDFVCLFFFYCWGGWNANEKKRKESRISECVMNFVLYVVYPISHINSNKKKVYRKTNPSKQRTKLKQR